MFSISWRSSAPAQGESKPQTSKRSAPGVKRPAPPAPASAPTLSLQSPAAANGENRSAVRLPACAIPSITGLSLSPHGAEAILVNISTTGLLAECGERLKTGNPVRVNFEGTFTPRSVEGRVARNSVGSMSSSGIRYHVGIAFNEPIDLALEAAATAAPPAPAAEAASTLVLNQSAEAVNRW